MKYDFSLDMGTDNSVSLILKNVKKNTVILEFGPANGRMTKYMKEQLNCQVYLVELDEEAGKQALQYGRELVIGDIENYEWKEKYKNICFDHIIFADVLEHLRNPLNVVIEAEKLLKEEGSILLSVPNLAHNSVIIDLMNNKFNYTSTGLLDDTHIHFFTKESIDELAEKSGLNIVKRMATYGSVGTIDEFHNSIYDIDGISGTFWNQRKYGEVYQFVYELSKKQTETEDIIKDKQPHYFTQAYFYTGNDWTETNSEIYPVDIVGGEYEYKIDMPKESDIIRIDPLNFKCAVKIVEVYGQWENDRVEAIIETTNTDMKQGNNYCFFTDDPWFIVKFKNVVKSVCIKMKVFNIDSNSANDTSDYLNDFFNYVGGINNRLSLIENENLDLQKRAAELKCLYESEKARADMLQEQRTHLENRKIYKIYKFLKRK